MLERTDIEPSNTWKKGEKRFTKIRSEEVYKWSAASFCTSDAEMTEFEKQIDDSISFLEEFYSELVEILKTDEIEKVALDFGIELRDVAVHCDFIPAKLLKLAGDLGIGIELSHYPA